jgi:3-deoxy-D-manno-octulosonic-acid transferase
MLFVYHVLLTLFSPFVLLYLFVFLLRRKDFRPGFLERLGRIPIARRASSQKRNASELSLRDQACFWVHAVSVGEVIAAVPLVKRLRSRFPSARIFFSTYTATGRATVKQRCPEVDGVFYFPFDIYPIVEKVIARVCPTLFLLVETDIWPIFLHRLQQKGIPSVLVNGRISARRLIVGPLYRKALTPFSYFCLQTEVDAERLIRLGIDPKRVTVTGNMKFAQAVSKDGDPWKLRNELGLPGNARILIAGSTHKGEEEEIIRCYQKLTSSWPDLFLLVAPRHPDRFDQVEALFRAAGLPCVRRSQGKQTPGRFVVLLDTLGELSHAYALGTFVFVGGSWVRRGGHNVMEPAAWGKPIFFGPYMDNYAAIAASLEREGAAIQVRDGDEMAAQIQRLSQDERQISLMGQKAAAFVARHQGAVEKNLDVIERVVTSTVVAEG